MLKSSRSGGREFPARAGTPDGARRSSAVVGGSVVVVEDGVAS
jgi:hypothetical protein